MVIRLNKTKHKKTGFLQFAEEKSLGSVFPMKFLHYYVNNR